MPFFSKGSLKQKVARFMRFRVMQKLMLGGIYATVPKQRIGVALVAFDNDARVLMLRHVFHPACPWGLPGGWLHRNESPQDGAMRELREETGLTAVLGPVVNIVQEPAPQHIGIAFLAQVQPGPLSLSPEIIAANWFPIDALPDPIYTFNYQSIQNAYQMQYHQAHAFMQQAS